MFPSKIAILSGGSGLQNNYSLEFDGTNDYVSVSRTESGGDLTVSLWVNPADTPSTNERVITQGHASDAAKRWIIAYFTSTSSYIVKVYSTTTGWTFGTITPNEWNHIAFTYDSGTIKTYVNGVSGGVTNGNGFSMPELSILSIGAMDGSIHSWNGKIDEVAIWNTTLSAGDVSALYQARGTSDLNDDGNSGNLVGWWRMGDGTLDDGNIAGNGLIADQVNPTLGSELITNGDMELDSDWASIDSPVTNEQSSTYSHGGTYSRHIENPSGDQGWSRQSGISTVSGKVYKIVYWVYGISGGTHHISFYNGSTYDFEKYVVTYADGSWTKITKYFTAAATSDGYLYFGGYFLPAEFYIDDVSIKEVNGNPGLMVSFDGSDIVTDVP